MIHRQWCMTVRRGSRDLARQRYGNTLLQATHIHTRNVTRAGQINDHHLQSHD